jgi:hypothetical protein|tara:strand:- start:5610 stop:5801 length:192 start_codon:yes stop_codon:yes gene_type:complete
MIDRQPLIDNMGDSLLKSITRQINSEQFENAHALFQEWVVDGVDPEDEDIQYEFLLLQNLSEL